MPLLNNAKLILYAVNSFLMSIIIDVPEEFYLDV